MRKKKPKFQKFSIPDEFLNQIYELTGNVDKNKGYFLCYIDEDGYCQLKYNYDSQATEFAIIKVIDLFINQFEANQFIESTSCSPQEEDEEED